MRARRRFAQHFLQPAWASRLVDAIHPASDDRVLEIGPGRGALTLALAPRVRRVIAVEIDRDLAHELARSAPSNVEVVVGDVLEVDLAGLVAASSGGALTPPDAPAASRAWRVVGNLPYNITSPILFRLLALQRDHGLFSDATLMVQKEVADRLVARPGTGEYGVLGITISLDADARGLFTLPPGAFRPAPTVVSSVVRLTFRPPSVPMADRATFERLVRQVFTQRRKTLLNALKPFAAGRALSAADAIAGAGLDPRARPETLLPAQFARLARLFSAEISGSVV